MEPKNSKHAAVEPGEVARAHPGPSMDSTKSVEDEIANKPDVRHSLLAIAEETQKVALEVAHIVRSDRFTVHPPPSNPPGLTAGAHIGEGEMDVLRGGLTKEELGVPVEDFSAEEREDIEEFLALEKGMGGTSEEKAGKGVTGSSAERLAEACSVVLDSVASSLMSVASAFPRNVSHHPRTAQDLVDNCRALSDAAIQLKLYLEGDSPPSLDAELLITWAAEVDYELKQLRGKPFGAKGIHSGQALSFALPRLQCVFLRLRELQG